MRTAQPFLPLWQATVGPTVHRGSGTLTPELSRIKDGIDEFKVNCGGFSVSVKPKLGQIFADSSLAVSMPAPCSLLWFRRMSMAIGTHDPNSSSPDCLFYGLGLEYKGDRMGYRLTRDGLAQWGGLG